MGPKKKRPTLAIAGSLLHFNGSFSPNRLFPMTDSHDRDRDRQSLRDLAKLSQQAGPLSSSAPASVRLMPPPASGVTDNSGLIDLERLAEAIRSSAAGSSDVSLPADAGSAPSAVPVLATRVPVASPTMPSGFDLTPLSPSVQFIETPASQASAEASAAEPPKTLPSPVATGGASSPITRVVLAAAVLAVGAIALVSLRKSESPAPTAAAPISAPAPAEVRPASEPAPSAPQTPQAVAVPEVKGSAAVKPQAVSPKPGDSLAVPAPGAAPPGVVPPPGVAPPKGPEAKGSQKAAGPAGEKSFMDEVTAAVGGKVQTAPVLPTVTTAGATPVVASGKPKPSQGEFQAALAKVKGPAHNCLGGQELEVKATLTFGSEGKAQRASALNAPSPEVGACIEAALMKATVSAFSDATFTAPVTVR